MADGTEVRAAIAAERHDLAAVLTGLSEQQWDTPTLCAGWRVREVVAHMTMPFRVSTPRVLLGMLKARGDFARMADQSARADAASLTSGELATCVEDNADHAWKPPGGGFEGALSHDVIHGLDFTVPLGISRKVPDDRLRIVLDGVNAKNVKFFGTDLTGVELRADDLDWSFGSGAPVFGAAQDLLLVLCGRLLPAGRLHGTPSARFTHTP
jgi:uncharacterized protein (TIGR03083 family)